MISGDKDSRAGNRKRFEGNRTLHAKQRCNEGRVGSNARLAAVVHNRQGLKRLCEALEVLSPVMDLHAALEVDVQRSDMWVLIQEHLLRHGWRSASNKGDEHRQGHPSRPFEELWCQRTAGRYVCPKLRTIQGDIPPATADVCYCDERAVVWSQNHRMISVGVMTVQGSSTEKVKDSREDFWREAVDHGALVEASTYSDTQEVG